MLVICFRRSLYVIITDTASEYIPCRSNKDTELYIHVFYNIEKCVWIRTGKTHGKINPVNFKNFKVL